MHKQNVKIYPAGNLPNQGIKVGRTTTEVCFPFRIKVMANKGSQRIPHWPAKINSSISYVPDLI